MRKQKNLALVAHDHKKKDLVEWVETNYRSLIGHQIICTGTTGTLLESVLQRQMEKDHSPNLLRAITKLKSGPLGGDQQLGAMIAQGQVDILIFFWDPMEPQPHDVDVKALLRIAVVYNIPVASNLSTADFLISSPLMGLDYEVRVKDYTGYLNRRIP